MRDSLTKKIQDWLPTPESGLYSGEMGVEEVEEARWEETDVQYLREYLSHNLEAYYEVSRLFQADFQVIFGPEVARAIGPSHAPGALQPQKAQVCSS